MMTAMRSGNCTRLRKYEKSAGDIPVESSNDLKEENGKCTMKRKPPGLRKE